MEPTIYKPGEYKMPGVYKGAGGIYNGLGVYNDGAGGGPEIFYEQIKDNVYPFVKIGSKFFIIENLKEIFPGLVNGFHISSPFYQENDLIPEAGFYYNYLAIPVINQWFIDNGYNWRIPSNDDLAEILALDSLSLMDTETWDDETGVTNETLFSARAYGYANASEFRQQGTHAYFCTSSVDATEYYYWQITNTLNRSINTYFSTNNSWPIRLVKDA